MRQLFLPLLMISLATACSQNPHLQVQDPAAPKVVSNAAQATRPAPLAQQVPGDRDGDGVQDQHDLCPDVPGPAANKGCPYKTNEDTDLDGVINEADRCPTVPGPAMNNGCPLDRNSCPVQDFDQDGVPNTDDRCPSEKGPIENMGCPYPTENDTDRDGTPDSDDRCPTIFGQVYSDGCPITDTDGDGVWDHLDQCPKVPGPATNRGCPLKSDTDGDSISDDKDKCPLVPGPVSNYGCPQTEADSDRDGVPDSYDVCPTVAGPVENQGCPFPREEEREVLLEAMASLKFDLDKAVIKESSFPSLEKVVAFLRKHPGATLKMVGHTDDQASDEYNMDLSRRRVQAVKDYLVAQNILPERTEIDARGESEPLVSIEGKEGEELEKARAKNRRVDMSVSYVKVDRESGRENPGPVRAEIGTESVDLPEIGGPEID